MILDERRSGGAAWIGATVLMLATMALHPTGRDLASAATSARGALLARLAHGLALASLPLALAGALALTRALAASVPAPGASLALLSFGLALVSALLAALTSGFVAPHLFEDLLAAKAGEAEALRLLVRYNHELNQAAAAVFVVASSLAIGLWSRAILRAGGFPRGLGLYGLLLATLTVLSVVSGHVELDVHGFGAVVLGQAGWSIAAGIGLLGRGASASTS
jgi:hypothetical protein